MSLVGEEMEGRGRRVRQGYGTVSTSHFPLRTIPRFFLTPSYYLPLLFFPVFITFSRAIKGLSTARVRGIAAA